MTSPLRVNHLCLISPPGALQSKYQCGRPTKTVGRIERITQAARVLHHRRAGFIIRGGAVEDPAEKGAEEERKKSWKKGRVPAPVLAACCGSGPLRCSETR